MKLNLKQSLPYLGGFLGAVLLATAAFVGGVWYKGQLPQPEPQLQQESCEDCIKPFPAPDTSDWKTYRNEKLGFEIKYPEGYYAVDYTERYKSYLAEYDRRCSSGEMQGCGGGGFPDYVFRVTPYSEEYTTQAFGSSFHDPLIEPYEIQILVYENPEAYSHVKGDKFTLGNFEGNRRIYTSNLGKGIPYSYATYIIQKGKFGYLLEFNRRYYSDIYLAWTDTLISTFKFLE